MNSKSNYRKQDNSTRFLQKKLDRLYKTAILNYRYVKGSKSLQTLFDAYPTLKENPENLTKLGLLYDHAAMESKRSRKILESKARENYRKAIKLYQRLPSAWWGLARIYWHNGDKHAIPLARKAYRLARESSITDVGQYAQNLGLIYQKLGNKRRAKYWLKRGTIESPREWGVHFNLMRHYLDLHDYIRAREFAKNVIRLIKKEKVNSRWIKDVRHLARTTLLALEK